MDTEIDSAACSAQERLNAVWDLIFDLPVYRSLRNFRGQVQGMLELYLEPLSRHSSEAYAEAYATYFTDMTSAGELFFPEHEFAQSFPAQICFVPMAHPTEAGKAVLAEKAEFSYLSHFLYTDFYRGLMTGNLSRRCHNCGRYFLLAAGYNTCYSAIMSRREKRNAPAARSALTGKRIIQRI